MLNALTNVSLGGNADNAVHKQSYHAMISDDQLKQVMEVRAWAVARPVGWESSSPFSC